MAELSERERLIVEILFEHIRKYPEDCAGIFGFLKNWAQFLEGENHDD
jgi:hypothetical protein